MGGVALAPLALYHGLFSRLFWFGDEFDLIDQIDRLGFWNWLWRTFAENFVPLFKVLWGGAVLGFHGSYAAMIALLWLTHAANVVLLGRVMRTCGIAWTGVILAQAVFGLTSVNLETLAWTVQWSAVLSVAFMLLALEGLFRAPFGTASVLWSAASALSFSRGVLTGPLVALGSLGPRREGLRPTPGRRAAFLAGCFFTSLAVALLIGHLARGNHQHIGGHYGEAAIFGTWYYCLNPARNLFSVESIGWHTVIALGLCKVALVGWALARSTGRRRLLFALLVAFDLGNAALLGIGRYHTGLAATLSSRYQYASLIGIVPLAAFGLSHLWERVMLPRKLRGGLALAAIGVAAALMCRGWSGALEPFTAWRGSDSRHALLDESGSGAVPGIPGMTRERARELIAKYNLH
jgi:hypothetical protein